MSERRTLRDCSGVRLFVEEEKDIAQIKNDCIDFFDTSPHIPGNTLASKRSSSAVFNSYRKHQALVLVSRFGA